MFLGNFTTRFYMNIYVDIHMHIYKNVHMNIHINVQMNNHKNVHLNIHMNFKRSYDFFIQGVPQYCFHFSFVNFSAFKAPRSSILDIFQQPFQCRF